MAVVQAWMILEILSKFYNKGIKFMIFLIELIFFKLISNKSVLLSPSLFPTHLNSGYFADPPENYFFFPI